MHKKTYLIGASACLIIAVTALNIRKRHKRPETKPPASSSNAFTSSTTPTQASRKRRSRPAAHTDNWTLPFRIAPRLSEQQTIGLASDPAAALDRMSSSDSIEELTAMRHLLVAWSGQDPAAAMQWVTQHAPDGDASLWAALAAGQLIHGGPDAMQQFIAQYDNDQRLPSKQQGRLEELTYGLLGKADTIEAAMNSIQQSKNTQLAGALIGGIEGSQQKMAALDYMEAKKIKPELNYWNLQSAAQQQPRIWADWAVKRNSELLPELIQSWARQDPKAAKAWIDTSLPPGDQRLQEILQLIE